MIRRVIQIDEEKCNGCGLCAEACHESAIGMVNGKAKLLRDDYCDGLGDCLPGCPTGAITFVEREAAAYDEAAVMENKRRKKAALQEGKKPGVHVCPGTRMHRMAKKEEPKVLASRNAEGTAPSQLGQWPCQIKLVAVNAPYFDQADLLIAADCTAYAYARMHENFMKGRITLIGCPKLDMVDYHEKLAQIFTSHEIRSITLVRMEVPCCGGLEQAAKKAIEESGKVIPLQVATISISGNLLSKR